MNDPDQSILARMRFLGSRGEPASAILRYLYVALAAQLSDKLEIINYMRKAFHLSLQEAAPIAGWSPDGTGELGDDRLDGLIMPFLNANMPQWASNTQ